jgi:hypothetical protein
MNKLNWRFINQPRQFLSEVAVVESEELVKLKPEVSQPQVLEFDLVPYGHRGENPSAARLYRFDSDDDPRYDRKASKQVTKRTRRIPAYWLPWVSEGVADMRLGTDAPFFFTSGLAGCQVRVIPPDAQGGEDFTQVLHIAGNVTTTSDDSKGARRGRPQDDPKGTRWRNAQAVQALSTGQYQRSRALSSTGQGALGYSGECVNVVGLLLTGASNT